jgi:hypothetical protein
LHTTVRSAWPRQFRAALAAFDGLSATYTPGGLLLDRLTPAQRMILACLDIPLPWPEKPC